MLTHVVLMKFADPADAAKSKQLLEDLIGRVESIRTLEVRLDELRTDVSWDLFLITTHDDADGLKAYQTDPVHLELAGWLKPRLAARAVVDYTAG
jgi:hypothetical protein